MIDIARVFLALMILFCSISVGCGEDDASSGGVAGDPTPIGNELPPPPTEVELDERSFFPVAPGLRWRYRREVDDWAESNAIETDLSESEMSVGTEDGEFVRKTIVFSNIEHDGEERLTRQAFSETFVIEPSMEMVGPRVRIKAVRLVETAVSDGRRLRTVERVYEPPYLFISDAWRTGQFDTRIENSETTMTETVLEGDATEPRMTMGIINLQVITSNRELTVPTPSGYREGVREIKVTDDFSDRRSRTYWVERGVGIIQWRYRDASNQKQFLVDANFGE